MKNCSPPRSRYKDIFGCVINPPVYIAEDAEIENSIIGPYATIGSKAVIKNSLIKNSIVGEQARVISMLLSESIIGNNAHVLGKTRRINIGDSSEVDLS